MENDERTKVIDYMTRTGCCKRCILRFTANSNVNFEKPEESLREVELTSKKENADPPAKKVKANPCSICLNLLDDDFLDEQISSDLLLKATEYDSETYNNVITFPISITIREYSMLLDVKENHPAFFQDRTVIPLNKAWSWSIQKKLGQRIGKKFVRTAPLIIHFTTTYKHEEKELENVSSLVRRTKVSRNLIEETLGTTKSDLFRKHFPVPPLPPADSLCLSDITCCHDAIFIAGRYCKYSRDMGQTPWVINKVKKCETSVQEIIFEAIDDTFRCKEMVFAASGREDFDVRTLGKGRPFFIRIVDAKITTVAFETFRKIEARINKSRMISVLHLQHIAKNEVERVKEGEQFKKKSYRALCIIDEPASLSSYLEKINKLTNIVLQQKTPIRVYHRRSAGVRQREIYSIEARLIPNRDNLFELDLVTQAGTYVKEFVHGDLGRTKPSLRELIGGFVDIVTLDVTDIHLDFPPAIEYEKAMDSNKNDDGLQWFYLVNRGSVNETENLTITYFGRRNPAM